MFIVISHHHCKPGQVDVARERVDKSCTAQAGEPGFVFRYRIERATHPNVVSAITAWNDESDYERYRQKRGFGGGSDLSATPYEKIETEAYQAPVGRMK